MNEIKALKITKKETVNIPVEENVLSYIEGKMYEVHSRRDLIASALSMNMPMDNDNFKAYQRELEERTREYNIAVNNMLDEFIKPAMRERGIDTFNYNVNFETGMVECTYTTTTGAKADECETCGETCEENN